MHCLPSPSWAQPLPASRADPPWWEPGFILGAGWTGQGCFSGPMLALLALYCRQQSCLETQLCWDFPQGCLSGGAVLWSHSHTSLWQYKRYDGNNPPSQGSCFLPGINCLQQIMKYHLYVFFLLEPPKFKNFRLLHTLIPFPYMQPIFGFLYGNPLYKKQIMEYTIFMRFYRLAPKVTMWINVLCGSVLQHELPNC